MKTITLIAALTCAMIMGCTDSSSVDGDSSSSAKIDGGSSDGHVFNPEDSGTIDQNDAGEKQPDPGEFKWPCKDHGDCDSGLCVDTRGGMKCTKTCVNECPVGYACKIIQAPGGDNVNACIDAFLNLCKPCTKHTECGKNNKCVSWGKDGSFCGHLCSLDSHCLAGYSCQDAVDKDGKALGKQCKPKNGQCKCSQFAINNEAETECSDKEKFASCNGTRKCTTGGLTACDFDKKAELCNNLDDDCDGQTDEELCDDGKECTVDKCKGGTCSNAPKTGGCQFSSKCFTGYCSAGECLKGKLVKCDDGNPCTKDYCDNSTGCENKPDSGQKCDEDGNQCTTDVCKDGKCKHIGHSKKCDDDNKCTLDEKCEPTKATCSVVTKFKNCQDGNVCTDDLCNPKTGCYTTPAKDPDAANGCPINLQKCQKKVCAGGGICSSAPIPGCK